MEILHQIQVPGDASALGLLQKLQGQPMCLRDFTELVTKLQSIERGTTSTEVRTVARCILEDMRKQFDALVDSLRQRTREELVQRYACIQARVPALEAMFCQAYISSKREFVTKADIYLERCVHVIGSLQPQFQSLSVPGHGVKDIVFAAVKSWDENNSKRPCNGHASLGDHKRPCTTPSATPASIPCFSRVQEARNVAPHAAQATYRTSSAEATAAAGSSRNMRTRMSPRTPSKSSTAPPVVTLSASSSDYSSASVASDTSDDSDFEYIPPRRGVSRRNVSIIAGKESAAQRKNDQRKAKILMALAKQERKLAKEDAKRLKREEKGQRKLERKRQREAKKEADREAKRKVEEDKRLEEEKRRSEWGSWLFGKGGPATYSDDRFSAAFAKAYARAQREGPSPPPAPRPGCSIPRPPLRTTPYYPASIPKGGIVPNENLMDLIARLEKIAPYAKTFQGAMRFLGATTADEGKKNYKKMLLLIHPDKLEPAQRTEQAQRRTGALLDVLQQCKARITYDAAVDRIDAPKGVTYKVTVKEVRISWQPSAGAARYEVSVLDTRSDRYHILAVCEPEYDEAQRRYQTIEECTTATLTPAKFPKLVHLWENKTMQVQIHAISQKGTKSGSSAVEVAFGSHGKGKPQAKGIR